MADRILTLCDMCAEELKTGGMRVKQVSGRTTTEKKKECEWCKQRDYGSYFKQYVVGGVIGGRKK